MSDSSLDTLFLQGITAGIETLVNQALSYDPASQKKIATLTDVLAVKLTIPDVTFYVRGQSEGIAVFNHCEAPVSTHLQGSPIALLSLLKPNTSVAKSGISIAGNTQLLQEWQTVLQQLDIDWEEAISQVLGDIAGPIASQQIRTSAQWASSQLTEHQRLIGEYLTEELKATPSKPEVEQLFNQISKAKIEMDRLTAKVHILNHKIAASDEDREAISDKKTMGDQGATS